MNLAPLPSRLAEIRSIAREPIPNPSVATSLTITEAISHVVKLFRSGGIVRCQVAPRDF